MNLRGCCRERYITIVLGWFSEAFSQSEVDNVKNRSVSLL